jgi:hypothetical protein
LLSTRGRCLRGVDSFGLFATDPVDALAVIVEFVPASDRVANVFRLDMLPTVVMLAVLLPPFEALTVVALILLPVAVPSSLPRTGIMLAVGAVNLRADPGNFGTCSRSPSSSSSSDASSAVHGSEAVTARARWNACKSGLYNSGSLAGRQRQLARRVANRACPFTLVRGVKTCWKPSWDDEMSDRGEDAFRLDMTV